VDPRPLLLGRGPDFSSITTHTAKATRDIQKIHPSFVQLDLDDMWRTLRTKVSASRLRTEQPAPGSPLATPKRTLASLRRASSTHGTAISWRNARSRQTSEEPPTPSLTPDQSPALSSPDAVTPTDWRHPSAKSNEAKDDVTSAVAEDPTDVTQGTVVLRQDDALQPQNLSQAILQEIWGPQDATVVVKPPTPVGLGITARDKESGRDYAFPSPKDLQSLANVQAVSTASLATAAGAEPTLPMTESRQAIQQHLKVGRLPASSSSASDCTTALHNSLTQSPKPLPRVGSQTWVPDMSSTGFPSPPARIHDRTGMANERRTSDRIRDSPLRVWPQDEEQKSQAASASESKPAPKLRAFELSQVVGDSFLAQRRRTRLELLKGSASRRTSAVPSAAAQEKPDVPSLASAAAFKDRYPPRLGVRKPDELPPMPLSAPCSDSRGNDFRPAHLSPHLTLSEAVQLSLDTAPVMTSPMSRHATAPRRLSGLMYLRDGVPISATAGGENGRRISAIHDGAAKRTSTFLARSSIVEARKPSAFGEASPAGPVVRAGVGQQAMRAGLAVEVAPERYQQGRALTQMSEATINPLASYADVSTHVPATPPMPPSAPHPPDMACLAGCCKPVSSNRTSIGTFRSIKRAASSYRSRTSMESVRRIQEVQDVPQVPPLPNHREVKKAKSSPELKDHYGGNREMRKSAVLESEGQQASKRRKHEKRKSTKSVSSLRFFTRAFSRSAVNEPELPRDHFGVAAAFRDGTQSGRRRSVDSDESWGPSGAPQFLLGSQYTGSPVSSPALRSAAPIPSAIPTMNLRRPSTEAAGQSSSGATVEELNLTAGTSAGNIRHSTVASAMLVSTTSWSGMSSSSSDAAVDHGVDRAPSAPPATVGVLQRAFQFPPDRSSDTVPLPRPDLRATVLDPPLIPKAETEQADDADLSMARTSLSSVRAWSYDERGFGFIQYFDPEDAADAKYHMDGHMFLGREITVVFAEENRKKPTEMRARERVSSRGRSYDRRLRSRSPEYSVSPRGRSRSRSRSYSPAPKRKHHSRSPSPRERSLSRSPVGSRSRSASPAVKSPRRERSLSVSQ